MPLTTPALHSFPSQSPFISIPYLLNNCKNVHDRGYTFLKEDGTSNFLSYQDLCESTASRVALLHSHGLSRGDRVGLIMSGTEDFLVTFLSCLSSGIIPMSLSLPLALGALDSYIKSSLSILKTARTNTLLTTNAIHNFLSLAVKPSESGLRLLSIDSASDAEDTSSPSSEGSIQLPSSIDDTAFLQFTSGSTSTPKGVIVSHGNILANYHLIASHALKITSEDVFVSWLPHFHDMGLAQIVTPLFGDYPSIVVLPTVSFLKKPSSWFSVIDKFRGTITFAPNFAFGLAVKRTPSDTVSTMDLSCLRVIGSGAEPINADTVRAFYDHFLPSKLDPKTFFPCYGMAETTVGTCFVDLYSSLSTDVVEADSYHSKGMAISSSDLSNKNRNTAQTTLEFVYCGRPLPGHSVKIVDRLGQEVPDRSIGEIVYSGPSVTGGYYNNPSATEEVYRADGLWTGDLGYIADGNLYVTGRLKDIIIINGRNYDPQSFEWLISEIEGIRKGSVVAVSCPGKTTEKLIVIAESTGSIDSSQLSSTIRSEIRSHFALSIDDVVIVKKRTVAKTSSGKLKRHYMRSLYIDSKLTRI